MGRSPSLLAWASAALLASGLCACSGSRGSSGTPPPAPSTPPGEPGPAAADAGPRRPSHPPTRIVWEALAVERERAENPRFTRPQRGVVANQKIVLVNESHPDAKAARQGRTAVTKGDTTVAVVPDEDMEILLQGFQQAGFYALARPTMSMQNVFDSADARGRITVERADGSVSIVSMRGQGLNAETKGIPKVYSDLKQAIAAIRNQTPTLNVRTAKATGQVTPGR